MTRTSSSTGQAVPDQPRPAGLQIPPGLLDLDPEHLRELGYWVVDRTVAHLTSLQDRPVITVADEPTLRSQLGGPLPLQGSPLREGLDLLAELALETQQHGDHPRYFARVPGPSSHVAMLGEWLATGMQSVATSWGGGAGPTMLEVIALEWLRDALGLAPRSEGILQSGGSLASATALIVARHENGPGMLYLSDQTHASIRRNALAVGWASEQLRILPSSRTYHLQASTVRQAVEEDLATHRRPGVVVATVGSTNTGAIDEVEALADLCQQHGIWLHVDGAYGGATALTARHRVPGLDRADSVVLDPHKWLFQPYDIACVWVAHPGALNRTFAMSPEYLRDTKGGIELSNRSLELSRRGRGTKLWLTLRTYGLDRLRQAVERGLALADFAEHSIRADARFTVITPAQLGVVTFAVAGLDDAQHLQLAADLTSDGFAALTSTVLSGRTVLRLCTINPRTTESDISRTLARLLDLAPGAALPDLRPHS